MLEDGQDSFGGPEEHYNFAYYDRWNNIQYTTSNYYDVIINT